MVTADNNDVSTVGLPATIEHAIDSVADGWRGKVAKALLKIIGIARFPEATVQISDALDTLDGRRIVARTVAQAVAERVVQNPDSMERAMLRFWGNEAERQNNLEAIALQAAEHISQNEPVGEPQGDITEDWRRKFCNFASDVSSSEMQQTWSRILVGKV